MQSDVLLHPSEETCDSLERTFELSINIFFWLLWSVPACFERRVCSHVSSPPLVKTGWQFKHPPPGSRTQYPQYHMQDSDLTLLNQQTDFCTTGSPLNPVWAAYGNSLTKTYSYIETICFAWLNGGPLFCVGMFQKIGWTTREPIPH